jgi:hypothetical protein
VKTPPTPRLRGWLTLALAALTASRLLGAFSIEDFEPRGGPPGTEIVLFGEGFGSDLTAIHATIGGLPAVALEVNSTSLRLLAPAASGQVVLTIEGTTVSSDLPFLRMRLISGAFEAPPGFDATGYFAGTLSNAKPANSFSASVAADLVTVVWAWRGARDPIFCALVYPGINHIQIDAASTAMALVALSPFAPRGEPADLLSILDRVTGTPELAALAGLIAGASASGHVYLDDGRFPARYEALLITAFSEPEAPAVASTTAFVPPGAGYIRALMPENAIAPQRLKYHITQHTADPPAQKVTVDPSVTHPTRLHQNLEIWRVNPAWFADGFEKVNRMGITDIPTVLDMEAFASGFVSAKLGSSNLSPADLLAKQVSKFIIGKPSDNQFVLPRDRSGVYVVNAFSGNIWFGTEFMDPGRSQAFLRAQIDPNGQWVHALTTNIVITAIDLGSVILPEIKILGSKHLGDIAKSVATKVAKAITTYKATYGELNRDALVQITSAAVEGVVKASVGVISEAAGETTLIGTAGNSIGKVVNKVNKIGKVSSALQALERGASLITPTHYAVERAVIVIGDPFVPQIRAFQPDRGAAGAELVVYGENLPVNFSSLQFSFVKFEATGNPPPIAGRLNATIISGSSGVYRVRVPSADAWTAAFGPGHHQVFLSVRNNLTGGEATTLANPAPNYVFNYRAPPLIDSITPQPARAGDVVRISGPDFDPSSLNDFWIEINGVSSSRPHSASMDRIFFALPTDLTPGSHTLRVVFRDASNFSLVAASNALSFQVHAPFPPPSQENTRSLYPNVRNLSNLSDGNLSLYEAMALAAGTLGRSITIRPKDSEAPFGSYESDWIDLPIGGGTYAPGAAIRDSISFSQLATGPTTINVNVPLPPLGDGDQLWLHGIVLDGSGGPADLVAWDLRGVAGHELTGGTFRNFRGGGILLGNDSRYNELRSVTVEMCDGDGIVFAGSASDNRIYNLAIRSPQGMGARFSGSGASRNRLYDLSVLDSTGHGILLEAGANGNIVEIKEVRRSGADGIRLTGIGTSHNRIGLPTHLAFFDVAASAGHGVHVLDGASFNRFSNLSVSGSGGDGFRFVGPTATRNNVVSCATSFDRSAGGTAAFFAPNAGHSVVIENSAWNTIGTRGADSGLNTSQNFFGGSLGGATVLITGSGSHHNVVDASAFGYIDPLYAPNGSSAEQLLAPAATHGVHITNGAHDNLVGSDRVVAAAVFLATPNGAAVRIEGPGADRNRVIGSSFGSLRTDVAAVGQTLKLGVHILNGAAENRIGEIGNSVGLIYRPFNSFGNATEAAIRLENVSATLDASGNPLNGNHLINNRLGQFSTSGPARYPEVAIHLKGQVTGQFIGGPTRAHGNQVPYYGFAAVWIEGGVIPSYAHRNRITGTWTSSAMGTASIVVNTDPFIGPLSSHALLISGGASGQVVGEDWVLYNQFSGGMVCAYLDGGTYHWLRASWFDWGPRSTLFLRDGFGHRIGGDQAFYWVQVTRGGSNDNDSSAGIVLAGGGFHRVEGTLVGDRDLPGTIWGSRQHGILIHDSYLNRIGGPVPGSGNIVIRSSGDGIRISGPNASFNELGYNRIGHGHNAEPANAGSGVHLTEGAHDNLVGGFQAPWEAPNGTRLLSPNLIRGNLGDGVLVTGPSTVNNRILSNSIVANGGLGIRHANAGNRNQPPPALLTLSEGFIRGHVASLASTPEGSMVEVFMNPTAPEPEGEVPFGRGFVQANGTFSIVYPFLPPAGVMTATATHVLTGDTSEFTPAISLPATFGLRLAVPPGEQNLTRPWTSSSPFSALALTATSVGSDVEARILRVRASGSAEVGAFDGISLFEDVDLNGVWSAPDKELAAMAPFEGPDSIAVLALGEAYLRPDESRRWVLRLHPAAGSMPSGTIKLDILSDADVDEFYWQPLGLTGVAALWPLQSALWSADGGGDGRPAWRSSFGLPPDGTGAGADDADPDGDGLSNFLEYALGSSPIDPTDSRRPVLGRQPGDQRLTLTYYRARSELNYAVEAASVLAPDSAWTTDGVDQGSEGPEVTASAEADGPRKFLRLRITPVAP